MQDAVCLGGEGLGGEERRPRGRRSRVPAWPVFPLVAGGFETCRASGADVSGDEGEEILDVEWLRDGGGE